MRTDTVVSAPSGLEALIESLLAIGPAAAIADAVAAAVATARIADAEIAPYMLFVPGRYARNCVFRNADFEIVAMCWPAGAVSTIHDHGGSRGYVKMLRGSMQVENYALLDGGHGPGSARIARSGAVEQLATGDVALLTPEADLHRVSADAGAAVSLHVYVPPIGAHLVFDEARGSCRRTTASYDMAPRR